MGKAKKMIDELIEKKAQGNSFQINNIKMKLMFKGIMPEEITDETPDTEELISKIESVADQFNLSLTTNN
jgi:spore coat protein CotF